MTARRFRFDPSVERHGEVIIGGSPLRMFRLTAAGVSMAEAIGAGSAVAPSRLVEALLDAGAVHPLPGADGPFGPGDVTVVTPTHGEPRHRRAGSVVVDDGSRPPIRDATVRLPANRGPGAARNAGAAVVTTDVIAFVDADVETDPRGDWLRPLLGHFADDRVAAVAPRVRTPGRGNRISRYEARYSPLDLGPDAARVAPGTRVAYVPGAALVVRRDVFESIGGFDEALRFGEDVDLVWRLVAAGRIVRYEPSSVVRHEPRTTWAAWARQRFDYGSSAAPLATRHGDAVAPVRTTGWSIATWGATVAVHPVAGLALATGTGVALVRRLPALPPEVCLRFTATGHAYAGRQLAAAVRRGWWPLLAVAGIGSRRARIVLGLAAAAAGSPLRLADDVAYSAGVWRGCLSERSLAALWPVITSWPARRT